MPSPPFRSTILPNSLGLTYFSAVGDSLLPGLLQFLQLGCVPADALVALFDVGGVSVLDLFQRELFSGVVGGADLVGALERHVLEHVGQAGGAMGSCAEPASTWVKNEKTGASGRSQMTTVSPLASFLTVMRFSKEATS